MKNYIRPAVALAHKLIGNTHFVTPFAGKNAWVQVELITPTEKFSYENFKAIKVTKETPIFALKGETMVPTSLDQVCAQK